MSANLFQQMYRAICSSMGSEMQGGISKRSVKMDPTQDIKDYTYSWSHFEDKVDRAHNFCDFVKENYGKANWKDVTQEMKQDYLLSKHTSNGGKCCTSSVLTYDQQLVALGHICDKFYNTEVGFATDKDLIPRDNVKFRDLVMKPEHFKEAMQNLKDGSEGKFGAQIGFELGIRGSSIENLRFGDLHFDTNKIDIVGAKGGKDYGIDMPERVMTWLKDECAKRGITSPEDRLVKCKAETVEKALHRGLERAGHHEYAEHKTGNHASRKYEAQQFYTTRIGVHLELGEDWKKAELHAKQETSQFLGHGSQRCIDNYISRYGSQADYGAAIS